MGGRGHDVSGLRRGMHRLGLLLRHGDLLLGASLFGRPQLLLELPDLLVVALVLPHEVEGLLVEPLERLVANSQGLAHLRQDIVEAVDLLPRAVETALRLADVLRCLVLSIARRAILSVCLVEQSSQPMDLRAEFFGGGLGGGLGSGPGSSSDPSSTAVAAAFRRASSLSAS